MVLAPITPEVGPGLEPAFRESVSTAAEVSRGTVTVTVLPSMTVRMVVVAWSVGTAVVKVTVVFEH